MTRTSRSRTRARWRRAAGTSARVLAGAVAGVLAIGLTAAAVHVPWPGAGGAVPTTTATPAASSSVLVCPGGPIVGGRNAQDASAIEVAAPATTVSGADPQPSQTSLGSSPATAGEVPVITATRSEAGAVPEAAAAQMSSASTDDLTGFAAAACTAPAFESWLVGGATTLGESAFVVIANPGEVTASVDVTVFGGSGAIRAAGATGMSVAPHTRVVVALTGLAPSEPAPVVRVTATRTPVAASLNVSTTQTLQPVGLDVLGPAAAPSPVQTIVGLTVPAHIAPGFGPATVSILAPDHDTTARVTAYPAGGGAPVQSVAVSLSAGHPAQTTLSGLPAGNYTVRLAADEPIVGGALVAADGARDLAWYVSAPTLTSPTLVAVPGDGAAVSIATPGAEDGPAPRTTFTPLAGGDPVTLSGGSAALSAGVWRIESATPVVAAVGFSAEGRLAGFPVPSGAQQSTPVVVYP